MHEATLRAALALAAEAVAAGQVVETPYVWDALDEGEAWKKHFMWIDPNDPQKYLQMGEENRSKRLENKAKGLSGLSSHPHRASSMAFSAVTVPITPEVMAGLGSI